MTDSLVNFINTHLFPPSTLSAKIIATTFHTFKELHPILLNINHSRSNQSSLTPTQTSSSNSPVTQTLTNSIRPLLYQSPLPIIQNACLIPLQWSTTASIPSLPRPTAQPSASQNPQIGSSSYSLPLGFTNDTTSSRSTVYDSGSAVVRSDIRMTQQFPSYILPSDTWCEVNKDTSADSFICLLLDTGTYSPAAHFSRFTCTRSFPTHLSTRFRLRTTIPCQISKRLCTAKYDSHHVTNTL